MIIEQGDGAGPEEPSQPEAPSALPTRGAGVAGVRAQRQALAGQARKLGAALAADPAAHPPTSRCPWSPGARTSTTAP
ncbi:hypothetical protein NKH77_44155 [Streptomyces sp. M19]